MIKQFAIKLSVSIQCPCIYVCIYILYISYLPVVVKFLAQHVLLTVLLTHTIMWYVVFGSRYTNIVLLFVVNSYKRGYIELINCSLLMGILVCEKSQRSLFRSFTLDTKFGEFLFYKTSQLYMWSNTFYFKRLPCNTWYCGFTKLSYDYELLFCGCIFSALFLKKSYSL